MNNRMISILLLSIAFIMMGIAGASDEEAQSEALKIINEVSDSIESEEDKLDNSIEEKPDTDRDKNGSEKIQITIDKSDTGGVTVVEETKDTVFIYKKSHIEEARNGFQKAMDHLREKGWGGSGGPWFGVMALYMDPIIKVAETDGLLRHYNFDFNEYYEPIIMTGGGGYGGVGNGLRLGGGGMGGSAFFPSKNTYQDSGIDLEVKVKCGGFLIEKAKVFNKMNYVIGGYLGSGSITLNAIKYQTNERSNFDFDSDNDDKQSAKARFLYTELHGGFTYSFFPLIHIGMEASVPFFFSSHGFEKSTSDFFSVNPAIRAKIMFGTLG